MFCTKCGKEVPEGSGFCEFCGAPVSTRAVSQRYEQPWQPQPTVVDQTASSAEEHSFVYGDTDAAPSESQTFGVDSFKKRGMILSIGMVVLALSLLAFIALVMNYSSVISYHTTGLRPSMLNSSVLGFLIPALEVLILATFIVSGWVLLGEGSRLKQLGARASWLTMCGIGDFLLAGTGIFRLIAIFVGRSSQYFIGQGLDSSTFSLLMSAINTPVWLIGIAAGILYIASSNYQKKANRSNGALLIAGIALLIYPLFYLFFAPLVFEITSNIVLIDVAYIVVGTVPLVARSLRGLAPRSYPKTIEYSTLTKPLGSSSPARRQAARYGDSGSSHADDAPSIGLTVLCFFIPLLGLILYLVWKDATPLKAKSCGKGALIGVIVYFLLVCLLFTAIIMLPLLFL